VVSQIGREFIRGIGCQPVKNTLNDHRLAGLAAYATQPFYIVCFGLPRPSALTKQIAEPLALKSKHIVAFRTVKQVDFTRYWNYIHLGKKNQTSESAAQAIQVTSAGLTLTLWAVGCEPFSTAVLRRMMMDK
jgi:hypothetical protein